MDKDEVIKAGNDTIRTIQECYSYLDRLYGNWIITNDEKEEMRLKLINTVREALKLPSLSEVPYAPWEKEAAKKPPLPGDEPMPSCGAWPLQ